VLAERRMGNDIHAGPLLPERAPSEGPRSTAAMGPAWTSFPRRGRPQARKEHQRARSMRAIAVTLHTPPYWYDEEIELDMFCRRRARLCVEPIPIAASCRWRRE
jgi:hypothetical protein